MRATMPDKRPADNVKLSVEYPQEEEFSIGNVHPYCYYYFWYFPEEYRELYEKYVRFKGVEPKVRTKWMNSYRKMIIKALIDTDGKRAIFKNPVMTGRVRELLETFPDAKFIHIHRNPVIVYLSTRKFFTELFPTLWFHEFSEDKTEEMILETFEKMMNDFEESKKLFNENQLYEIKFETFEQDPVHYLKEMYDFLGLDGFEEARPAFENYVNKQKHYKKNKYKISSRELDAVLKRWAFAMERFGYEVPENIEVIN
jgi:hypothetical protein